jgi:hypothetical protein
MDGYNDNTGILALDNDEDKVFGSREPVGEGTPDNWDLGITSEYQPGDAVSKQQEETNAIAEDSTMTATGVAHTEEQAFNKAQYFDAKKEAEIQSTVFDDFVEVPRHGPDGNGGAESAAKSLMVYAGTLLGGMAGTRGMNDEDRDFYVGGLHLAASSAAIDSFAVDIDRSYRRDQAEALYSRDGYTKTSIDDYIMTGDKKHLKSKEELNAQAKKFEGTGLTEAYFGNTSQLTGSGTGTFNKPGKYKRSFNKNTHTYGPWTQSDIDGAGNAADYEIVDRGGKTFKLNTKTGVTEEVPDTSSDKEGNPAVGSWTTKEFQSDDGNTLETWSWDNHSGKKGELLSSAPNPKGTDNAPVIKYANTEKLMNTAASASQTHSSQARSSNRQADEVLAQEEWTTGMWGNAEEKFADVFGTQDEQSVTKKNFQAFRNSEVLGALPPGVATDKDIEIFSSGFPDQSWSKENVAGWLRGQAKASEWASNMEEFKGNYISKHGNLGSQKGEDGSYKTYLQAWKEYSQEAFPEAFDTKLGDDATDEELEKKYF